MDKRTRKLNLLKLRGVRFTIKEEYLDFDEDGNIVFESVKSHYPETKEKYYEILGMYLTDYGAMVWRFDDYESYRNDGFPLDWSVEDWIQQTIDDSFPLYEG